MISAIQARPPYSKLADVYNRCVRLFSLAVPLLAVSAAISQTTSTYVLRGTVVTPDVVIDDGYVAISGEKITAVGPFSAHPAGLRVIETAGILAPGLIDLHDHISWNLLPRWKPNELFPNRYAWQQITSYAIALRVPHDQLVTDKLQCEMNLFGEVKAIVHGATSVVGSLTPAKDDPSSNACVVGMARNLDAYSGFYAAGVVNTEKLKYEVFPFQMEGAAQVIADLRSGKLTSFIAHVAEGSPTDASAAREFTMFQKEGFLVKGTSIVHGVALGDAQFKQMAAAGVGFVWSPRSNVELYGATADVVSAKADRVKIALAPDWSPSGSDGVLEELKYAATWDAGMEDPQTRTRPFSAAELVKMTTVNAAELAGVEDRIGSLAAGKYADVIVVRRLRPDAYESLIHSDAAALELVIIDGKAVYGDAALMRRVQPEAKMEDLAVCGVPKLLNTESYVYARGADKVWASATHKLKDDLVQWGTTLSPLAECNAE